MSEHIFVVGRFLRFAQFERGDDKTGKIILDVVVDEAAFELGKGDGMGILAVEKSESQ